MAGIDADLMREARALFARFQEADLTNAARLWRRIAADAPKLKKGRPKGSADPDGDHLLLRAYDLVVSEDPLLQPEAVNLVSVAFAARAPKIFGRHCEASAIEKRLRRLLNTRGDVKRFPQREKHVMKARWYLAKALKNPQG